MDGAMYKQAVTLAFEEDQFAEVQHLIETHSLQFPRETEQLLHELCEQKIEFELVKNLKSVVHLRPEMICNALRQKHWNFLFCALYSDWNVLVLDQLKGDDKDLFHFVRQLYREWDQERSTTPGIMHKFCSLVVENEMYDLFKDMVDESRLFEISSGGFVDPEFVTFLYKCLVKVCAKDQLRKVLENVRVDERYCCRYLTICLASRLKQWKLVRQIVNAGPITLQEGAVEVFVRAMSSKAWVCAAHVLQAVMQTGDSGETGLLLDIQVSTYSRFLAKQGFCALVLKPYLRQCMRHKLYAPGALVAAWAKKWSFVKVFLSHLQQGITDGANITVLEEMMKNRKFRMVYDWLQCPTQKELGALYVDSLLWEAVVNCRQLQARAVVEQLMMRCEDSSILGQVLYHIILFGQHDLLHKFITGGLLQQTDDLGFAIGCAVDMVSTASSWLHGESYRDDTIYRMLITCLEAGCSHSLYKCTHFAIDSAVKRGRVPVLQLLYDTGALSSTSLGRMQHCLEVSIETVDEQSAATVKTFLQRAEDTPRSLKTLCCFSVSRQMGCGADRKQRALELGLPMTLTRQVLLLDVLYLDTTSETD